MKNKIKEKIMIVGIILTTVSMIVKHLSIEFRQVWVIALVLQMIGIIMLWSMMLIPLRQKTNK